MPPNCIHPKPSQHMTILNLHVGNYNYLRGYKTNDIMDRHLNEKLEWRAPVFKWLIITPFIEGGVIGRHPGNLKNHRFRTDWATTSPLEKAHFELNWPPLNQTVNFTLASIMSFKFIYLKLRVFCNHC